MSAVDSWVMTYTSQYLVEALCFQFVAFSLWDPLMSFMQENLLIRM